MVDGAFQDFINEVITKRIKTLVVAGHYCLSKNMGDLSHENETEEACFAYGAQLVSSAIANDVESSLVLWINDIGIDITEREAIKSEYQLPSNYIKVLDKYNLPADKVLVLFESSMRNKASVILRKIFPNNRNIITKHSSSDERLVRCVSNTICEMEPKAKDVYAIEGPNKEMLVVKEGPNPKCNLILATLFEKLSKDHSPDKIINIFNELYVYRLSLGVHVARKLMKNNVAMSHFFCDGYQISREHF